MEAQSRNCFWEAIAWHATQTAPIYKDKIQNYDIVHYPKLVAKQRSLC